MEQQNNAYQTPAVYEDTAPLTIGNYLIMFIVGAIPVVGVIMMLIWAFNSGVNKNKQNWARASLILALVGVVLCAVFSSVLIGALSSLGSSMQ